LWDILGPYLGAEGIELDDVEVLGGGQIVRITVDSDEPVGVDLIAELSRRIGRMLDAEDLIKSSYTLEVSSPGLERKLNRPRHYDKSVGRAVKVKTFREVGGTRIHNGTLISSDDTAFAIDVGDETRTISYADVSSARTVFVWDKSSKTTTDA
jgi:ribosome maturation factor RimP